VNQLIVGCVLTGTRILKEVGAVIAHWSRNRAAAFKAGSAIAAAGLLVAACSSGSSYTATSSAPPGGASSPAPANGAMTVQARSGALGTFLTDAAGKSLYMFASDTPTRSTCTGQCLTYWPPFDASRMPAAGSGVTASSLGTITSANGPKQVTYNGHPLYYFLQDKAAGDTNGQGSDNFGAKWWLLTPAGDPITASASGSAPSSSASSGPSGYGGY